MFNFTSPLQVTEGYTHRRLTEYTLEQCEDVLDALQSKKVIDKYELSRLTGFGVSTLTTLIHILRNGILPKYNYTIGVKYGYYYLTSDKEEIKEYQFTTILEMLARMRTQRNVARVFVASTKDLRKGNVLRAAAEAMLRNYDYFIGQIESYHNVEMENCRNQMPKFLEKKEV